jgi:hypothetical protein
MPTTGSSYKPTASENLHDLMSAAVTVIFGERNSMSLSELIEITIFKCSINLITIRNPICSHAQSHDYIHNSWNRILSRNFENNSAAQESLLWSSSGHYCIHKNPSDYPDAVTSLKLCVAIHYMLPFT